MANLFVVAGHSKGAPGARAYNGLFEHYYTQRGQQLLARKHRILQLEGSVILDADHLSLREVIGHINANAKRGDYCIDIHFNNNNPAATGTEGYVCPRGTTRVNNKIATEIIETGAEIMDLPVRRYVPRRTYKYPQDIGRTLGILYQVRIPVFLYEVCFLTRKDMSRYLPVEKEIWEMVAATYKKYKKLSDHGLHE